MAVVVGIVAAIALLARGLYPADLPTSPDPDFINTIFNNRCVLWAARLLLVAAAGVLAFGGAFIVLSIGIRMKNGEWLRRAGPFEISEEKLEQNTEGIAFWRQLAVEHREELLAAREQIRRSDDLIENLHQLR
jgi:hypothetical protein